jgi:hypothetical protein
LVIRSSEFSDADPGDTHAASEFEIWRVNGDQPVERVWLASLSSGVSRNLIEVALTEGVFEGSLRGRGLEESQSYVARVRYRDSATGCDNFSPWSQDRGFRTDDAGAYLFDPAEVRDVYLEIPPESWDLLNQEARPPNCVPWERSYQRASLRFEDQVFEGVGIKIKGGCGSARTLDGKPGFKVNLDWDDPAVPGCPEERRLFGQKHLTLNNSVQDRSFAHERLGYSVYKAMGVPVPRQAHVRVHVNGTYYGTYLHLETFDRAFLKRWFTSSQGMLYEGTYSCDLVVENIPTATSEELTCLSAEFHADVCDEPPGDGDDPVDYEPLRKLVTQLQGVPRGTFYPELTAFFDYDNVLSTWAVDGVIANWDGFAFRIRNNYRVYHDPKVDRWSVIPSGIDQTFVGDQDPWDVHHILSRRCAAAEEPDCQEAFVARLRQAIVAFESLNLAAEAEKIHELVKPHVYADTRKEHSNEDFERAHRDLLQWIAERPERMREILRSRGL